MKNVLLALLVFPCILASQSQMPPYAEILLQLNDEVAIERFGELGLEVDHVHPVLGANKLVVSQRGLSRLSSAGLPYTVLEADVSAAIERRNLAFLAKNPLPTQGKTTNGFELGSMGGFYTYAEVLQQLDEMQADYPNLITPRFSIGVTSEGRTIWAVKISDNPSADESAQEAPVYFDALHHAREPASMATVINFMFHVLEGYAANPQLNYLVDNREIFIVPVVNPDGYVYNQQNNPNGGGMWRKNRRVNNGTSCRGVDINRNYDTDWGGGGSSGNACSDIYRGAAPFSEAESRAVRDFTTSIGAAIAYTTHTSGGYWLGPDFSNGRDDFAIHAELNGDCLDENEYIYGDADVLLGYASGTTQGWMYDELGSLSWTPEIGTTGFWPSIPEIIPLVNQQIKPYEYACWVAGAMATFQSFDVTSAHGLTAGGNLALDVRVKNRGLSTTAQNVTVAITSDHPGVTALTNTQAYGNIAARDLGLSSGAFTFAVAPSVADGTVVNFTATVSQEGVISDTHEFQITAGAPSVLFADGGENGAAAWSNGGTGSVWQASSEDAHSGAACFVDSRLGHTAANNNRSFTMNTAVSLAGAVNPRLEFAARWGLHTSSDYVRLQASANGAGWVNVTTAAMQNVNGGPAFRENEPWTWQSADLSAYAGQSIRFRFVSISNGSLRSDGFYFDDFRIVDYGASAPTCGDGVQNGDETGVDCGGPDCAPCATGCTPVTIISDNFESGYGNWTDGGTDCNRTNSATYANSGTISVALRDNTNSSVLTTKSLDLSAYAEVTVDFTYYPRSMDNASEDFFLQVSTNGGNSFMTVEEWNRGDEFENDQRYFETVAISGPFSTNTQVRFRCDASADYDWVYLDDISLTACQGGPAAPTCSDGVQNGSETGVDCGGADCSPCFTCSDGIQNGSETGVDCGGPDCGACPVTYCNSSGNSTQYEWIQSVTVAGDTRSSGNNGGYGDFTSATPIALSAGPVSLTLQPGFAGGAYAEAWSVYVDYNADGDFADAGERVFQGAGSGATNGSFVVPGGLAGPRRMRVQMQYQNYNAGACGNYSWGEVEDYTLVFDGAAKVAVSPANAFDLDAPAVSLYPNPASDALTVRLPSTQEGKEFSWKILDLAGRVIMSGRAESAGLSAGLPISLGGIRAGAYLFHLSTDTFTDTKRFVVQAKK